MSQVENSVIHFHHTDERFCGSTEQCRRFTFDETEVSCGDCCANDGFTLSPQGVATLREFGFAS